jgi:hypothetical protein
MESRENKTFSGMSGGWLGMLLGRDESNCVSKRALKETEGTGACGYLYELAEGQGAVTSN